MDVAEVLLELVGRAEQDEPDWGVTSEDMAGWIAATGLTHDAFLDGVALELARQYDGDELPFDVADDVANALHGFVSLSRASRPDLFDRVFSAFDEGEYYHDAEGSEDPELTYTQPLIKQVLAESAPRSS